MAPSSSSISALTALFFFFLLLIGGDCFKGSPPKGKGKGSPPTKGKGGEKSKKFTDVDYLGLATNLEYLETDFFLCATFGHDLSKTDDWKLASEGPAPRGCLKANIFDPVTADIIKQFAFQEIGHLKAIKNVTQDSDFQRPQLDISPKLFANFMNTALDTILIPPFNPYACDLNFLIASYVIPYVGLNAYIGSMPHLQDPEIKKLVAGLLAVESGQDAVIRALLYQHRDRLVLPYRFTVQQFTRAISALRDEAGNKGTKDEGIVVDKQQGAEGKVAGNVLAGDEHSVGYARDPDEVIQIIYGNSDKKFGLFFPEGAGGVIADSFKK